MCSLQLVVSLTEGCFQTRPEIRVSFLQHLPHSRTVLFSVALAGKVAWLMLGHAEPPVWCSGSFPVRVRWWGRRVWAEGVLCSWGINMTPLSADLRTSGDGRYKQQHAHHDRDSGPAARFPQARAEHAEDRRADVVGEQVECRGL